MIKTLFITQEFSSTVSGGGGVYAYEVCMALSKIDGMVVHVIAPGKITETQKINGNLIVHKYKTIFLPLLQVPIFHFQVWRKGKKLIKTEGIDIIHTNENAGITILNRKPSVATIHHPVSDELKFTTFIQKIINFPDVIMERITYSKTDRIVVPSHLVHELLSKINQGIARKTNIILNGINEEIFQKNSGTEVRSSLGLTPDTTLIFFPGGARAKRKGSINLINCLKKVDPKINFRCLISGLSREANWATEMHKAIQTAGLEEKIIMIGEIPFRSLPNYYGAADFIVYPSLFEGFGLPILEAMISGKAIITTRTGEAPYIISNHQNGILIGVADEAGLLKAINLLLSDRELVKNIGDNAWLSSRERFSWEKNAKLLYQEYINLQIKK